MKKTILGIFILALFFGMLLPQSLAQNSQEDISSYICKTQQMTVNGNTLYVGRSGPNNYTTIQEAINDAVQDDTIFVYNGIYQENLVIAKRISVKGENPDITFIEGISGDNKVIQIFGNGVKIHNFTITGDPSGQDGIQVFTLMENSVITNNQITNCAYGIYLQVGTQHITICDNTISECEYNGIRLQESDRNYICNNKIEDCNDAAIALLSLSKQNNISENEIINNYGGIKLSGNSEQNTISKNLITQNDMEGIALETLSNGNAIEYNNITDNFGGIKISGCSQNIITRNTIADNRIEGIILEKLTSNTIVSENNFIENKRHAQFRFSSRNIWENNYWDNWIGVKIQKPLFQKLPKLIVGLLAINFDRTPALEPYP